MPRQQKEKNLVEKPVKGTRKIGGDGDIGTPPAKTQTYPFINVLKTYQARKSNTNVTQSETKSEVLRELLTSGQVKGKQPTSDGTNGYVTLYTPVYNDILIMDESRGVRKVDGYTYTMCFCETYKLDDNKHIKEEPVYKFSFWKSNTVKAKARPPLISNSSFEDTLFSNAELMVNANAKAQKLKVGIREFDKKMNSLVSPDVLISGDVMQEHAYFEIPIFENDKMKEPFNTLQTDLVAYASKLKDHPSSPISIKVLFPAEIETILNDMESQVHNTSSSLTKTNLSTITIGTLTVKNVNVRISESYEYI